MKKKITYILSLLMIVCMLGACGSDNAEKTYGGYTTDELHTERVQWNADCTLMPNHRASQSKSIQSSLIEVAPYELALAQLQIQLMPDIRALPI